MSPGPAIYVSMVGRSQGLIAVIMAYTVMIILVSPAVPSPATTLTSKHTIQPPHFMVPLTALLFTNAADLVRAHQWIIASQPKYLALHGSDLVDLNTARLC